MSKISIAERWQVPVYNDPSQVSSGLIEIDLEKCTGCGLCVKACPADALVLKDKQPQMRLPGINECMGCGDCMPICSVAAITLVKGNEFTGYYKTIDRGSLEFPRL